MEKRGQVTLYIIVGILIVVAIVLIFIFQNELGISTRYSANPSKFIEDCVKNDLAVAVESIISTGGVYYSGSNKEQFREINGSRLAILCYTNKSRTSCTNTHPLLNEETKLALTEVFTPKINACFNKLKKDYPNVDITTGDLEFDLDLEKDFVFVKMRNQVTLATGENSESFNNFDFGFSSKLPNFLELANIIVTAESSCKCNGVGAGTGQILVISQSATNTNPFLTSGPNINCDADLTKLAVSYPNYLFARALNLSTGEKIYTITSLEPPVQNFSFVVKNCASRGCDGPGGICFHHYHDGGIIHYSSRILSCHNNIHHYHDMEDYVVD